MLVPSKQQNLLEYFAQTCSACVVLWQVSAIFAKILGTSRTCLSWSRASMNTIEHMPCCTFLQVGSTARHSASLERTNSRWVQERSIANLHRTIETPIQIRTNGSIAGWGLKKLEQKLGKDLYSLDDPEINALGKSGIHRDTQEYLGGSAWR